MQRALERIRSDSERTSYSTIYLSTRRVNAAYTQLVSDVQEFTTTGARARKLGGNLLGLLAEGSQSKGETGTAKLAPDRMALLVEDAADALDHVVDVPGGDYRRGAAFVRVVDTGGESVVLLREPEFRSHPRVTDAALEAIRAERERMRELLEGRDPQGRPDFFAWVYPGAERTFASVATTRQVEWGELEYLRPGRPMTFFGRFEGEESDVVFLSMTWLRRDHRAD